MKMISDRILTGCLTKTIFLLDAVDMDVIKQRASAEHSLHFTSGK